MHCAQTFSSQKNCFVLVILEERVHGLRLFARQIELVAT